MLCAIWYHFYKLKNLKNTHGGVTFKPATLLKVALLHGCFSRFFKLYKWYQIAQRIVDKSFSSRSTVFWPLKSNQCFHVPKADLGILLHVK